jgi:hypothetical protein
VTAVSLSDGVAEGENLLLVGNVAQVRGDGRGGAASSHRLLVRTMFSADTSQIATEQPSAESCSASSRPIPVPPPVTTARFPRKLFIALPSFVSFHRSRIPLKVAAPEKSSSLARSTIADASGEGSAHAIRISARHLPRLRRVCPPSYSLGLQGVRRSRRESGDRVRRIVLVATLLLLPAGVRAELMKCRQPSGTLYVGSSPPPDCGPVSDTRERGTANSAASHERDSERGKPRPNPTPPSESRG